MPSEARWIAKCKTKSGMEEALPKCLKPVVELSGMRAEPTTRGVLMEQLELLGDLLELFKKQLEELKGLQLVVLAIRFTLDEVVEHMS